MLPYHFEEEQPVRVAVYDIDSSSRDLKQHDFIGQAEFSVANVIVAGKEFVMNLIKPGGYRFKLMWAGLSLVIIQFSAQVTVNSEVKCMS